MRLMTLFLRAGAAITVLALFSLGQAAVDTAAADEFLPTDSECSKLENPDTMTKGWCVAINRRKGNCLACHNIITPKWPEALPPGGNIAPPLVAMKQRYPDKAKLRIQIYDALSLNPRSVMPPFGKHRLLSEEEIDNIVEFLQSI
jgi:sulfur-oxidizing protein SoxX